MVQVDLWSSVTKKRNLKKADLLSDAYWEESWRLPNVWFALKIPVLYTSLSVCSETLPTFRDMYRDSTDRSEGNNQKLNGTLFNFLILIV